MKLKLNSLCSALVFFVVLSVAAWTGCSKKVNIETAKLDYAFQGGDSTNQATVTQAIEAVDKADYNTALAKLKQVSADPKLNAEQKSAVNDVIQQLEKR